MKYREIGQRLGLTSEGCRLIVKREMGRAAAVTRDMATLMVEESVARIEGLLSTAYPKALRGDMVALEKSLKLIQELNKVRGLYPAAKSEVSHSFDHDQDALIAEARRRGIIKDDTKGVGEPEA
jgi:hypothetical protein